MNLIFDRVYMNADEQPVVLEKIAGNMYLYRYDLREEEPVESDNEMFNESRRFSFVEVRLKGCPNKSETIKHLIRRLVTLEDELKLLNDYNEVINLEENASNSEEYENYMRYLEFRKEIKQKVKHDFDNNNI